MSARVRNPSEAIPAQRPSEVSRMTRLVFVCLLLAPVLVDAAGGKAKNVVLFLADAGGIPTINAASLHGYGAPRKLFLQRMPHVGLSETSSAVQFVTDSAAGMTAIVTGQKTRNGFIAQSPSGERGVRDGTPLKTILEYAEERGLSTGFITNDAVTGATPASLYAKANDRASTAVIFPQIFTPRFGDGVDVIIGAGRPAIAKSLAAAGLDLDALAREKQRPLLASVAEVPPDARRAVVLYEAGQFELAQAMAVASRVLSRNPKGYFLMVEWDTHTDNLRRGLDRMVELDRVIEQAANGRKDTLLLFTADHSFDIRIRGGEPGKPLLEGFEEAEAKRVEEKRRDLRIPAVRMDNGHTGEEVLVAAQGPGAERVHGYMSNTDLFNVMMAAFGWK
jgi:alkaline phosphatase